MRFTQSGVISLFILALLAGGPAALQAAEPSVRESLQIKQGHELAGVWCKQCHLVDPEGTGFTQGGAPTFAEVASRPGQTREKIKLWLVDPHPPMPDLSLSRDEIENLTSYILSLREENSD